MFALEIPLKYTEKSITCLLYVKSICNLVSGSRGRSLIKVYYLNFDIVLSLKAVLAGNNSRYRKKMIKHEKKSSITVLITKVCALVISCCHAVRCNKAGSGNNNEKRFTKMSLNKFRNKSRGYIFNKYPIL